MKLTQFIVLLLSLVQSTALNTVAESVDTREPFGRVCLSVIIGSNGEAAFDPKASYGPDYRLVAHLDASIGCTVVTVALDPANGHLANGWRPQAVELTEKAEAVLPLKPKVWNLPPKEPFDFYVLFLDSSSNDAREIKRLVAAMQDPKIDSKLLEIQTTKLRELLTRQFAGSELSKHAATVPLPDEVGGTLRSGSNEFPWRRFSVPVNFTEAQAGLLIFSSRSLENGK